MKRLLPHLLTHKQPETHHHFVSSEIKVSRRESRIKTLLLFFKVDSSSHTQTPQTTIMLNLFDLNTDGLKWNIVFECATGKKRDFLWMEIWRVELVNIHPFLVRVQQRVSGRPDEPERKYLLWNAFLRIQIARPDARLYPAGSLL